MPPEPDGWGHPGGRETPGNQYPHLTDSPPAADVPAAPRSDAKPSTDLVPVTEDVSAKHREDGAGADVDAEILQNARNAIARGLMTPDAATRIYGLTPAEAESLSRPAAKPPSRLSITAELAAIQKLQTTDPKKYWSEEVQSRELELTEARQKLEAGRVAAEKAGEQGDPTTWLDPALVEEWSGKHAGGVEHHLGVAQTTARSALEALEDSERAGLQESFDALPAGVQREVIRFIAVEPSAYWRVARQDEIARFTSTEEGKALAHEWGDRAAKKIGTLSGVMRTMMKSMSDEDLLATSDWVDALSPAQFNAVCNALAGK